MLISNDSREVSLCGHLFALHDFGFVVACGSYSKYKEQNGQSTGGGERGGGGAGGLELIATKTKTKQAKAEKKNFQ